MKTVLALLGVVALAAGAEWDGLKVGYGQEGKGYYDMPWSVQEAKAQKGKWVKVADEPSNHVTVYSQPQDPRLLLLFDKKGTIAGIRLAFLKEGIDQQAKEKGLTFEFDYDNNPMYEKGRYFGKDLWFTTLLFISPKQLASGGRPRLNKNSDELGDGLYLRHQGKWLEINKNECNRSAQYIEGNCLGGMGKHYFKNSETFCQRVEPYWSLYDEGRLVGFGLAGFGSFIKDPKLKTTTFYEEGLPLDKIVRKAPTCWEEYIQNYGYMSMHVYLKRNAAKIKCPNQEWHSRNC